MMSKKSDNITSNYVIAGCGLSGMLTALALAKQGINSTIIEPLSTKNPTFFDDIRTTALTNHSQIFLEKIGVWQDLSALCGPINNIYVLDNKAPRMLHFSSEYTPDNQLMGYLIENQLFKKCLHDLVTKNRLIKLLDETRYHKIINNEDSCQISLTNNTALTSKLLIVCDGKNSAAKNYFFSNELEEDYKQKALTFKVLHEKEHQGTAVEHFLAAGPFAILPLKNINHSSVVWTLPQSHAEVISALSIDEITYLVQENFGPFLGKVKIVSKIASFPLKSHGIRKYYNKSIVLVADSAHTIHPLAGQGLNQGIKDIDSLTNLIATNQLHPQTILPKYELSRKSDNENMLLITSALNNVFSFNQPIFKEIRQMGFRAIETVPSIKKFIIKYAMGQR